MFVVPRDRKRFSQCSTRAIYRRRRRPVQTNAHRRTAVDVLIYDIYTCRRRVINYTGWTKTERKEKFTIKRVSAATNTRRASARARTITPSSPLRFFAHAARVRMEMQLPSCTSRAGQENKNKHETRGKNTSAAEDNVSATLYIWVGK